MKMTRIAVAVSTALLASSAFATNGTNMIGLGAQSNAMGGTGVAASYGSETIIANPAMIGKTTGTEFTFGGTYFVPSVESDNGAGFKKSTANDTNVVPAVSLSSRINNSLTFGIGMFGTSGMGVGYRKEASLSKAQSNMQIMKFAPTLAYNTKSFGLGISPILQYGALDINYEDGGGNNVGSGVSSDLGFGYNLGGYFNVTKGLTLGASYLSPISMTYKDQLSVASQPFVTGGVLPNNFSDTLEQPSEIKVGAEYALGNFVLNADYKRVGWGSAAGYKDFGWEDQDVFSVGGKYATNKFWVGAGYNYGKNPIKEQDGAPTNNVNGGAAINMFNNIFFPATTESHVTFGGGYSLTKAVSLEGAIVVAPEVTTTVNTQGVGGTTNTTKHSQIGYTFQVKYHF